MSEETLDQPEEEKESSYLDKRFRPLFVIFPFLLLASIFKIMHWPGKSFMLAVTICLITAHAISMLFFFRKNEMFTNIGAACLVGAANYYVMNEFAPQSWLLL